MSADIRCYTSFDVFELQKKIDNIIKKYSNYLIKYSIVILRYMLYNSSHAQDYLFNSTDYKE